MTNQVHIYRKLPNGSSFAVVSLMDKVRNKRRYFSVAWRGNEDIPAFWWNTRGQFSCPKAHIKVEVCYPHPLKVGT